MERKRCAKSQWPHAEVAAKVFGPKPQPRTNWKLFYLNHKRSLMIRPFSVRVPLSVLEDLSSRIALTRWPDEIDGADWDYGSNLTIYWATETISSSIRLYYKSAHDQSRRIGVEWKWRPQWRTFQRTCFPRRASGPVAGLTLCAGQICKKAVISESGKSRSSSTKTSGLSFARCYRRKNA